MTKKRIVLALGGNAILVDDPSAKAQKGALEETSKYLVDLVKEGHEVLISHGNGPQVGNLWLQQLAADSPQNPILPLDTCVAMTQGSIGYWLQNAMQQTLAKEKIDKQVVSLVTQVVVSEADPAFQAPTKPIGPFYSEAEMVQQKKANGGDYMEDAGRGFRKVVPSPKPQKIQEYPVIRQLLENGNLVIAAGGGGIPVVETKSGLVGVEAVIDKDFAAEKLAELIEADLLIILTGVPQIFVHFNQPNQAALSNVSAAEMTDYMEAGEFPAGSMLPKVEAALAFVKSNPNGRVLITDLAHVGEAIKGNGGTWIHA